MRRFTRLASSVWIIALMLYVIAGTTLTPFHGDESTQVYMSRDYAYQFIERDLNLVQFHEPPISAQEQDLRLLNGTINKYLIGLAWHVGGFTPADLYVACSRARHVLILITHDERIRGVLEQAEVASRSDA